MMKSRTSHAYSVLFTLFTFATVVCLAQKPELVVQTGHAAGVFCIAFHPGGSVLATGGHDGTIKLWDVATGEVIHSFVEQKAIYSIAFNPSGKLLASVSSDNTVSCAI